MKRTFWRPKLNAGCAADSELDARTGARSMIDLKPVRASDAELIFESWGRYPQNFARLTARVFVDIGDAERYLSGLFSAPASRAFHIVEPGGTVAGIVKAIVTEHRAQVGYVVNEPFRGRGFATRAVEALVDRLEADTSIFRIWATCALDNPASTRVLEKCGFQREGILKSWVVYPALGAHASDNYSYVKVQ
jgi:[ribosomal protein S5]-alanine N-acetyltransferase